MAELPELFTKEIEQAYIESGWSAGFVQRLLRARVRALLLSDEAGDVFDHGSGFALSEEETDAGLQRIADWLCGPES